MKKKKIGIMGGTFNPIHTGHLIMAERAYETMVLDEVWIMPTANPPHKQEIEIVSKVHRKEMVSLAIQDNPHLKLSLLEMDGEKPRYSYETMEWLRDNYKDCEFYYILGADSLADIETWREYRRFMSAAHILVAVRCQMVPEGLESRISYLKEAYGADIFLIQSPDIEISSSWVRDEIKNGRSVRYCIPDRVYEYIRQNRLYSV